MMGVMAAARTKRLRIGTGVSLAPFYNPSWLAEEVALLDLSRVDASGARGAASARGGRRATEWMLAAYVGHSPAGDPTEYDLEEVPCSATADSVIDQIRALGEAGMTYLMAAPVSRRSFSLLTDKVVPRVATRAALG